MRQYGFIAIYAHFQRCPNWAWLLRNHLLLLMERCLDSTARGVSIRGVVLSAAGVSCPDKEKKMQAKTDKPCIRRRNEEGCHSNAVCPTIL